MIRRTAARCWVRGSDRPPPTSCDTSSSQQRQTDAGVDAPERPQPWSGRNAELDHRDPAAGLDDPRQLAHRRRSVVDVAQQVGERSASNSRVGERQPLGLAADQADARGQAGSRCSLARAAPSIASLWSSATTSQLPAARPAPRPPVRCRSRRRARVRPVEDRSRRTSARRQRGSWPKLSRRTHPVVGARQALE